MPGALPASITYLHLGAFSEDPNVAHALPAALETLSLGRQFMARIDPSVLPASLTTLRVYKTYPETYLRHLTARIRVVRHEDRVNESV